MPHLSTAVRDHRHGRLRAVMRAHGLDAVALTGADFFAFASSHDVNDQSWERPFLYVLTADGASFAVLADQGRHHVLAQRSRGQLWVDRVIFYAETPRTHDGSRPATEWAGIVAGALRDSGLAAGRIGCDAVSGALGAVRAVLPKLELAGCNAALRSARWVKHAEEIAAMEAAAALSAWALPLYREELRPGRSLQQADLAVAARLVAEAERRFPGENFVLGKAVTVAGAAAASPHGDGAGCGRVLEPDSVAVSTIATRLNGMAMEAARTWLVGTPEPRALALFGCAVAAQAAGAEQAVAGRPVRGIDEAARGVVEAAGFGDWILCRSGHGIGVVQHDFPEDVPFNARALIADEVYAVEPGLYVPGLGSFRNADLVVVGDRPRTFPAAPRALERCRIP